MEETYFGETGHENSDLYLAYSHVSLFDSDLKATVKDFRQTCIDIYRTLVTIGEVLLECGKMLAVAADYYAKRIRLWRITLRYPDLLGKTFSCELILDKPYEDTKFLFRISSLSDEFQQILIDGIQKQEDYLEKVIDIWTLGLLMIQNEKKKYEIECRQSAANDQSEELWTLFIASKLRYVDRPELAETLVIGQEMAI